MEGKEEGTRKLRKDSVEKSRDFKSRDWWALANAAARIQGRRNAATMCGAVGWAGGLGSSLYNSRAFFISVPLNEKMFWYSRFLKKISKPQTPHLGSTELPPVSWIPRPHHAGLSSGGPSGFVPQRAQGSGLPRDLVMGAQPWAGGSGLTPCEPPFPHLPRTGRAWCKGWLGELNEMKMIYESIYVPRYGMWMALAKYIKYNEIRITQTWSFKIIHHKN